MFPPPERRIIEEKLLTVTNPSQDATDSGVEHTTASSAQHAGVSSWLRHGLVGLACLGVAAAVGIPAIGSAIAEDEAAAVVQQPKSTSTHAPTILLWPQGKPMGKVAAGSSHEKVAVTPTPTAKIESRIVSQSEVLRLVRLNFPASEVGNAMAVAQCESGQQSIVGETNGDGTTDWGIFQLNDGGTLQGAMARVGAPSDTQGAQLAALDAGTNIRAAAAIFADRGWSPWVCAYKQQIVAGLYSNEPGPMYGRYTAVGGPLGPLLTPEEALRKAQAAKKKAAKVKDPAKAKTPAKKRRPENGKPQPAPSGKPTPTQHPTPTPTPTPTATQTPTVGADPSNE